MKTFLTAALSLVMSVSGFAQTLRSNDYAKAEVAERIQRSYRIDVNPSDHSLGTLLDMESRLSASSRIQKTYGLSLDYRTTSLGVLLDTESRLSASSRIKETYGLSLDYRTTSLSTLLDTESRLSASSRIKSTYGVELDWRQNSLSQLLSEERKLSSARRAEPVSSPGATSTYANSSPAAIYIGPSTSPSSQQSSSTSSAGYSRYYDPSYRPPVGNHYVAPYVRKDGTFVQGHQKTNSDDSFWNNWSSSGNVNPYTGSVGTKTPPVSSPSTYSGGGTVSVSGYTRKDGTYVRGYTRRK